MLDDDDIFDAQQEAAREEYEMQLREQFIPEMYEEFARDLMSGKDHLYDEVIEQFTSERLQSFYRANPSLAENALRALEEARALEPRQPAAALVFAAIAIEHSAGRARRSPRPDSTTSLRVSRLRVETAIPATHNSFAMLSR